MTNQKHTIIQFSLLNWSNPPTLLQPDLEGSSSSLHKNDDEFLCYYLWLNVIKWLNGPNYISVFNTQLTALQRLPSLNDYSNLYW